VPLCYCVTSNCVFVRICSTYWEAFWRERLDWQRMDNLWISAVCYVCVQHIFLRWINLRSRQWFKIWLQLLHILYCVALDFSLSHVKLTEQSRCAIPFCWWPSPIWFSIRCPCVEHRAGIVWLSTSLLLFRSPAFFAALSPWIVTT